MTGITIKPLTDAEITKLIRRYRLLLSGQDWVQLRVLTCTGHPIQATEHIVRRLHHRIMQYRLHQYMICARETSLKDL